MALLEMAFAGNCTINVTIAEANGKGEIDTLFNEEAGLVIEVSSEDVDATIAAYTAVGVPCVHIGTASPGDSIKIAVGASESACIDEKTSVLRDLWEATSFQLEKRQRNPECVVQEEEGLKSRKSPEWKLTYSP